VSCTRPIEKDDGVRFGQFLVESLRWLDVLPQLQGLPENGSVLDIRTLWRLSYHYQDPLTDVFAAGVDNIKNRPVQEPTRSRPVHR
jgi:hypothetical protein